MTKKYIDITEKVRELRVLDLLEDEVSKVKERIESGELDHYEQMIDELIKKNEARQNKSNNVISMDFSRTDNSDFILGETQLLAAAGNDLGSWFAHPIIFSKQGFTLDVRKNLDSKLGVDVNLYPIEGRDIELNATLSPWLGQEVTIVIEVDGFILVESELYIDEVSLQAQGSGVLSSDLEQAPKTGELTIRMLNIK